MSDTIQTTTVVDMVEQELKNIPILAVEKIAAELKNFQGGSKEKVVSKFVASTLSHFCGENERFAEVVYRTPRTLSDCCAEVMKACGNAISDIDVYRGAVKHYFPNADVHFQVEIQITGEMPTEEEINRKPEPQEVPVRREMARLVEKPKPEVLQLTLF